MWMATPWRGASGALGRLPLGSAGWAYQMPAWHVQITKFAAGIPAFGMATQFGAARQSALTQFRPPALPQPISLPMPALQHGAGAPAFTRRGGAPRQG